MGSNAPTDGSPSLLAVVVGGLFSITLGALLGALHLATLPVETVRELPPEEERTPGQVYFLAGQAEGGAAWRAKRDDFAAATGSVSLTEGDLNQWARGSLTAPKGPQDEEESFADKLTPRGDVPNFRIAAGELQVSTVLSVPQFPATKVILQARGGLETSGIGGKFAAQDLYVGACPVPAIPGLRGLILGLAANSWSTNEEFIAAQSAWEQVAGAQVAGERVELSFR